MFTEKELRLYLSTFDMNSKIVKNSFSQINLLKQNIFEALMTALIKGEKSFNDLIQLPEINNQTVSFFLDGDFEDGISSFTAKYENLKSLGLEEFILEKIAPLTLYLSHLKQDDHFFMRPNVSGGLRMNTSNKWFKSFSEIQEIYSNNIPYADEDRYQEYTDFKNSLASKRVSFPGLSIFIDFLDLEITRTYREIGFFSSLQVNQLNGFVARSLYETPLINPRYVRETIDSIIKSSVGINNLSNDGLNVLLSQRKVSSINLFNLEESFGKLNFLNKVAHPFYSRYYQNINPSEALLVDEMISLMSDYKLHLGYSLDVYNAVVSGVLEW